MPEKQIIKQPCNTASPPLTHTIAVKPAYEQALFILILSARRRTPYGENDLNLEQAVAACNCCTPLITINLNIRQMKKILFLGTLLLSFLIFPNIGCKKDKSSITTASGFTWVFKGKTYQSNFDTAFSTPGSARDFVIMAGTGSSIFNHQIGPKFDLNSLQPGSYSIDLAIPGNTVIMDYTNTTSEILNALGGTLTIISNNSKKISGNFSATLYTGFGNEVITGTFNDVPIGY
jgi:hypothetical protein